jgi:carboxyl-terminal processing protease
MWSLAIVNVLVLPVMTALLPAWSFPLPWQSVELLDVAAPRIEPNGGQLLLASVPIPTHNRGGVTAVEPPSPDATAHGSFINLNAAADAESSIRTRPIATRLPLLLAFWLLGAALAFAPVILGLISLRRLERHSRLVAGGPLLAALRQLKDQLDLKCTVRLLVSDSRTMPMTWGICRTKILLPDRAECWPTSQLQIILLHELAHCQRRDCLTQLLAQIARAVYWFNPLAWLAQRELRALQERACDDLVLNSGVKPCDYAEQVLAVSTHYRAPAYAVGLASLMARKSKLERRVLSILDPLQSRGPLRARWFGLAAAAVFAVLFVLSGMRFGAAAVAADQTAPIETANSQNSPATDQTADRSATLAELRSRIAEQYFVPVDNNRILDGAIKGMVDALEDPYSGYLTPEMVAEMDKQISGTRVGIGAQLEMHEGQIRVVTPLEDSPALAAGIQSGDVILQIDGKPTAGFDLTEAVQRIAGPQRTPVRLTIGRDGDKTIELVVTRDTIRIPTVKGFQRGPDRRWSFLLDPSQRIGYAQIAQLGSTTPQELRTALESLIGQGLQGLILDLRFCPGGTLESAVAVAKLFLNEGTIVSIQGRTGEPTPITIDAPTALGDFPMVVLVNGQTASAAEIVAGALQDHQRAVIVGTRTIGKGSVQSLIKLDGDRGAIKLTTSQYRLPSGRNIDRRPGETLWGINPNEGYYVSVDAAQIETLLKRRQAREVIGKPAQDQALPPAEVTAEWIDQQQSDPQLAAALEIMATRVTSGQFVKVNSLSNAEIEAILKREDIQQRRAVVIQLLEQLNRELTELDKQVSNDER